MMASGTPAGTVIRPMRPADADQVLAIYQAGLDTGNASFETTAPSWEDFDRAKLPGHRHVAADAGSGQVLGWAAASTVSDRCVYRGVIEHSIYVHPDARRRGIGAALLAGLMRPAGLRNRRHALGTESFGRSRYGTSVSMTASNAASANSSGAGRHRPSPQALDRHVSEHG